MQKQIENIISELNKSVNNSTININRLTELTKRLMNLAAATSLGQYIADVQIAIETFDGDDIYINWTIHELIDTFAEVNLGF